MTRPTPGSIFLALAFVGAPAFVCTACDEKKSAETSRPIDGGAGTDKYATADPKLAKALQMAAAASPDASDNGPPPEGIFPPGVADRRHPKGMPTTVDTLSDGAEPRLALNEAPIETSRSSSYGPAALELGIQMGPRAALPTVDFGLALGPAKKDEGGADWLVVDVRSATPAKQQYGDLPPGTERAIASLATTQFRIKMAANGGSSDIQTALGKQAIAELGRLAESAAEALVFASVPLPSKPVGVGAQWIAETRMPLSGLDVIAYRAFRVKSIDGNRAHLTLDVKAYATSSDTGLDEVPKGATLQQVDAQAQGEMEVVKGELLARKSDVQQRVVMVFRSPNAPQPSTDPGEPAQPSAGMLTGQTVSQAVFVRGDDLRAALRQR